MTSNLGAALLAAQKATPVLQRDTINPHFKNKFVSLDSLLHAVLPVLNENGLVLTQTPTVHELGGPALRTTVTHAESGESMSDVMLLMPLKNDPQGQGSAITYARRYALMSLLGLVADVDDDGGAPPKRSQRSAQGNAEPKAGAAEEAPPSAAAPANGTYVTEAQRKRLFALAKEHGVDGPTLKEIIEDATGQGATSQIPRGLYDRVCAAVETHKVAAALADVPFE